MAELERLLAQSREEANQIRADARLVVDAHASLQSKLDACERARVDAESLLKSERKIIETNKMLKMRRNAHIMSYTLRCKLSFIFLGFLNDY